MKHTVYYILLVLLIVSIECPSSVSIAQQMDSTSMEANSLSFPGFANNAGNGVLLLTRFKSLEELKRVVSFKYVSDSINEKGGVSEVQLVYQSGGTNVTSILKSGINEADFMRARDGDFWDRVRIGLRSPFAAVNRDNLVRIEHLGRKRPWLFGKGDVAFFHFAEKMVYNILDDDLQEMTSEDLSEKGYLNTFNHVMAQAFMTTIFSERIADFVADVHERHRMPELITGKFTDEQMKDLQDGPLDNYIDIINNEVGQELGKLLRKKYSIKRDTYWTPELLADYLNDIQSYHSWALQIGFEPFRPADEMVIFFASKINSVMEHVPA